MYVCELVKPGVWLGGLSDDVSSKVMHILSDIESEFYRANTSLNMFEAQREIDLKNIPTQPPSIESVQKKWREETNRENELVPEICKRHNLNPQTDRNEIKFLAAVEVKKEKWLRGEIPHILTHNLTFIYANAFTHSVDMIYRLLKALSMTNEVPQDISISLNLMNTYFPSIHEVRNSIQHMDERSQMIGKYGKPLKPQPLDNEIIKAPQGALIKSMLNGNRLVCTLGDGGYGEVEISIKSMQQLQEVVQNTLNLFDWSGPKTHLPL